ncbi:LA_3696 family protein [Neomoorella thermoacetica]
MNGMGLVLLPEILWEKLGDDGAKELVDLINASVKNAKENAEEN